MLKGQVLTNHRECANCNNIGEYCYKKRKKLTLNYAQTFTGVIKLMDFECKKLQIPSHQFDPSVWHQISIRLQFIHNLGSDLSHDALSSPI